MGIGYDGMSTQPKSFFYNRYESHILCRIAKEVDFSFMKEACRDLYSQDQGAPIKYPPETMFCSTIVQNLNDYSNRDMKMLPDII